MKRKNPHAVALGRHGGKRRLETLTAAERSALARTAVQARWRKAKGVVAERWWCFYVFFGPDGNRLEHPHLEFAHRDKEAVKRFARQHPIGGGCIDSIEYQPTLTVVREFRPDTTRQVRALELALEASGEQR